MNVGEICCQKVVITGKQDSIYSVARLMQEHRVSHVIVVESRNGINVPLGLVSERDIVVKIIAAGLDLASVSVGDIMREQLLTANEGDTVMATLKRMRHGGIRRIVVLDRNNGLLGLLSINDILDSLTEQLNDIVQIIIQEHQRGLAEQAGIYQRPLSN